MGWQEDEEIIKLLNQLIAKQDRVNGNVKAIAETVSALKAELDEIQASQKTLTESFTVLEVSQTASFEQVNSKLDELIKDAIPPVPTSFTATITLPKEK